MIHSLNKHDTKTPDIFVEILMENRLECGMLLHKFKEHTIYAKPVSLFVGSHELKGYLYFDPKREHEEKEALTCRLFDIREEIATIRIKKGQLPSIRFF